MGSPTDEAIPTGRHRILSDFTANLATFGEGLSARLTLSNEEEKKVTTGNYAPVQNTTQLRLQQDLKSALGGASSDENHENAVRKLSDESQKSARSSILGYMKDKVSNLIGSARSGASGVNSSQQD